MIDLSIIIVNYNNKQFLPDCLSSIYQSTKKISLEVIFVDNNSSDNSVAFVKEKFPQVKIIQNKTNLGFCRANNKGLAVYQGRHALLLNTDTIVGAGALDQMVSFLDANQRIGAIGPKLLNTNGTPQHQGGLLAKKFWLSKEPIPVNYVLGAALMVRREVIDKVGGLDENFFFSNDDLDWCRRMRKAGWPVYFLPQAQITHHGGFTTKQFNHKAFVEGFRGGLYFAKKHYGWLAYQLYRILLIFGLLIIISAAFFIYPWLKNKEKVSAYQEILIIAIKGEIIPHYEENPATK